MSVERIRAWEPGDGARRATEAFRGAFAAEPDGVWSAPGRVNLIGEHTDYNGGLCLPFALPHRTYVALGPRTTARAGLRRRSAAACGPCRSPRCGPGAVDGWPGYAAGVAWAMAQAGAAGRGSGAAIGGFDAAVDSCVPYGAGLSSSAALECAVAVALDDVFDAGWPARTRAAPCSRRPASAPRTRSRARRRAAWTRPRRCAPGTATRCCYDTRDGRCGTCRSTSAPTGWPCW